MHQRDYILRLIEQLGAVLAEVRRRIFGGASREEVSDALGEAAGQAGFDLDMLRSFTLDTLHMFAAPTGEVEPARCWLMAELLYLDGLERVLSDDLEVGEASLVKARALYDLVRPAGGTIVGLPEAAGRIEEIDRLLADGGTP